MKSTTHAVIIIYNSLDGHLLEKPYRVLLENAEKAVTTKKKQYEQQIKSGIPVAVEYDLVSYEKKPNLNSYLAAKEYEQRMKEAEEKQLAFTF